tara:strand:+ start:919 stop:2787 length:1869 start_codon:yes stop_codon:yes gene_type:complete
MIELIIAGVFFISAAGNGHIILQKVRITFTSNVNDLCFSLTIGFGAFILAILFLGMSKLLYAEIIYAVSVVFVLNASRALPWMQIIWLRTIRSFFPSLSPFYLGIGILVIAGLSLILIQALAPAHGATDPLAYQMALPKLYLADHFLSFNPSITGALYPHNMGMLYTAAIAIRNAILAQIIHWIMAVTTCIAIIGFCMQYFTRTVGIWAGAIFSFMPLIVIFSPKGYVDIGLCFFQFMAFWAIFNWTQSRDWKHLLLAASITGLAIGVKHQGLATLAVGSIIFFLRDLRSIDSVTNSVKRATVFCSIAILLVSPWYLRAYAMSGNPIWPLANNFFDGVGIGLAPEIFVPTSTTTSEGLSATFLSYLPSLEWIRLRWDAMSPWSWTFTPNGWQKAIGPYFVVFIPGLLLFARSKKLYFLIGFCALYYVLLIRVLHMNPRYGLVLFAFLAILCGYVAERLQALHLPLIRPVIQGTFVTSLLLNLTWEYLVATPVMDVVFGRESRQKFLQIRESNYRVMEFANSSLPDSAHVLLQGIVKGYYCNRSYIWDHSYSKIVDYSHRDVKLLYERFRELGITHVIRMIKIPQSRIGHFPQYFLDPFHEEFRNKHLKLKYADDDYVLFEVM